MSLEALEESKEEGEVFKTSVKTRSMKKADIHDLTTKMGDV